MPTTTLHTITIHQPDSVQTKVSSPSSVWGIVPRFLLRSLRHSHLTAATLRFAVQLEAVSLDVPGLPTMVTNDFVTTRSTRARARAGRFATTARTVPGPDHVEIHRGMAPTAMVTTTVVATLALVPPAAAPLRRRSGHAVREHDGSVAPLGYQYSIFEGVGSRQQDLSADLILQALQKLEQGRTIVQSKGPEFQLHTAELRDISLNGSGLAQALEFASELHLSVDIIKLRS